MAKMLVMSLLPMASTIQVVEREAHPHFDFDGLKTSLQSLAAKSAKAGKIDQGTIEAVTGFLNTINTDLLGALEADRAAYQSELDAAEDAVHACDTTRNTWFDPAAGSFATWNTNVSGTQGDHETCRTQEGVTYANYTSFCKTMHDRVCTWSVCALPAGGFSGGDTDAVNTYMECVCDFFEEHAGSYYDERNNCLEAHALHDAQVIVCDGEQGEFEAEYCGRESAVQDHCEIYDGCRFTTEQSYLGIKSNVESLEAISQAQFVALKHLVCYGEQILNNSTDLSGCDSVSDDCETGYPNDCPIIVYDVLDSFIECTEPVSNNYPCTAAFTAQYYAQYDNTFTPVDDCTGCTDGDVIDNFYGGGRKTDPN